MKTAILSFLLLSLLCLSQADSSFSKIEQAIADFEAKIQPLLAEAEALLVNASGTEAADHMQKIIQSLQTVKTEGLALINSIKKSGLSKFVAAILQASIGGVDKVIAQLKDLLPQVKQAAQAHQDQIDSIVANAAKPKPLKASFNNLIDTVKDISSQTQAIAKTCFQAFINNVPSSFCWKKGIDWGTIPQDCPEGYIRGDLGGCYQPCKAGYQRTMLVCWQVCEEGDRDLVLTCKKKGVTFGFYGKHSYVPSTITNFNKNITCPEGQYKAGAICYRDCGIKGMVNCGTGACALSKGSCLEGILKISVDFLMGLGKFVSFIASHTTQDGNLTGVVNQVTALMKKVDEKFLQKAFEQVKTWIGNNQFKQLFVDLMVNFTTNYIQSKYAEFLNNSMIVEICNKVHGEVANQMQVATKPSLVFGGVDLSDVQGTIEECAKIDLSNGDATDELMCIKKALKTAAGADATGITSMAAAFMNPVCGI